MASIDCAKFTAGQAGGLSVHFDAVKRLECEHENPHIDKSKSHLNSFHDCTGYSDMLRKQKERVEKVDEIHPPGRVRKDRVTAVMMEIPVPKAISDAGLTDQFLQDTYTMIGDLVGKDNMCGMTTHRDEVHDYIDHGGVIRTSLEHGHAMVVPYAHWTAKESLYGEDGKPLRDDNGKIRKREVAQEGVNAKHFLTRSFLKKLQDHMQDMVLQKYGISYQTSQEPLHMTVEDLKRESARAAAVIEKAELEAQQTQRKATEAQLKVNALGREKAVLESKIGCLTREFNDLILKSELAQTAYDEMQETNSKNLEVIQQNKELIQRQEDILSLIQSYEEYEEEALEIGKNMDLLEAAAEELPNATRLFKSAEANAWIERMNQILKDIRRIIEAGICRLQLFEKLYVVDKNLSEPIVKRAEDLNGRIFNSAAKVQQKPLTEKNQECSR